jgi:PST family polysaccharide transporter
MEEQEKIHQQEQSGEQQSERNRYRSSFAATLLFSGVQIYQIIIRIIKSKFVALFIGPAGMGIQSLLHSTTDTISAATNLGINTSSVKTIAAANSNGDKELISRNVIVQRRLIWITGLFGMLVCALLAPLWSQTSFGSSDYIWSFVAISVIILLDQLNKGELALLQGMQQKKQLARANIIGQSLNAIITIPLYYFFGVNAIVAAFVIGSLISLFISLYYSRRLVIIKVEMPWKETFSYGREMIKLGFFLSLQFLLTTLVVWIIRNYISKVGGVEEVGLYSAGTAIVTNYIGLVFTAIAADYFPRLAATKNNEEMGAAVRTQAELTILLLAPLVIAFLVFIKPVIILLYSDKFLPIENMMYWSISAVLLQAMGWAMSYTLLAKARPLYFFLNELVSTAWGLPIKLLCYKYWGLTGFGMATMIVYALYLLQILFVCKKLFRIKYDISQWRLFLLLVIPIMLSVTIKLFMTENWSYAAGTVVMLVTVAYSLLALNKKMDLKTIVNSKLKRTHR